MSHACPCAASDRLRRVDGEAAPQGLNDLGLSDLFALANNVLFRVRILSNGAGLDPAPPVLGRDERLAVGLKRWIGRGGEAGSREEAHDLYCDSWTTSEAWRIDTGYVDEAVTLFGLFDDPVSTVRLCTQARERMNCLLGVKLGH